MEEKAFTPRNFVRCRDTREFLNAQGQQKGFMACHTRCTGYRVRS